MTRKFKEGDKIRMLSNCGNAKEGETYILQYGNNYNSITNHLWAGGLCHCQGRWELINDRKWDE